MTVLSLVAELKARAGREADLRAALKTLVAATRLEEGCLTYDLHVGNADPGFFLIYENWQTVPHWDRHMASPHIDTFKAIAADLVETSTLHLLTKID